MATIKDIARELNLSHSVVSRALNSNPDANARVAPETKLRVEEAARRLGFRRNRIAEFLKRGRMATIGVFLPEYSNRLIADLMMGLSESAAANGFPLNFYFGQSYQSYADFISGNIKNPNSGIITYPVKIAQNPNIARLLQEYHESGGKAVVLNAPPTGDSTMPVLYMDEAAGTAAAAECLAGHNCELYIATSSRIRGEMFCRCLDESNTTFIPSDQLADVLLDYRNSNKPLPLGVFATTDVEAMRCLTAIRQAGFQPGREIMLVGYDDLQLTALTDPPLTTIHQPFRRQGCRAVEKLINIIYDNPEEDEAIKPFLVKRSTA